MRKQLIPASLLPALVISLALADNVTVHNTIGMLEAPLVTSTLEQVGSAQIWNTSENVNVRVNPLAGRSVLSKVYIYLSNVPPPLLSPVQQLLTDEEKDLLWVEPNFGKWPYVTKYKTATAGPHELNLSLAIDLPYLVYGQWGEPWLQQRLVYVAVCVEMKTTDIVPITFTAWAFNPNVPAQAQMTLWGENAFAFAYELQHPMQGNFVGPVHGLGYRTPTHTGTTGDQGGFSFYPGEDIKFWIGSELAGAYIGFGKADQRFSPLDIFPGLETSDPAVINMTRLLLGLDSDGNANGAIEISETSAAALKAAMASLGIIMIDFGDTYEVDAIIAKLALPAITEEVALAWLDDSIGNTLFRRNVSKHPAYAVDKPKLDITPVWVPAKTANGVPTTVEYKDKDGNVIDTRVKAKPLFVTYTEERDPHPTWGRRNASDVFTAVSMDDGATWKRFNVSHMAWMSSYTLKDTGERFPGNCRSPQQKIAQDKILVVWTSAYARGGKPSFAIKTDDSYPYDDAYAVNDVWGVRGTQGSVDYDLDKDVGDQGIGEIPYYAMWACRGVLVWEGNASRFPGHAIGDIVWFKPERLTSGRRDAFIPVVSSAKDAGFAVAWQEDPGGLRPGQCMAGGEGWSGATVHKKTDIWYSFIKWADFDKIDANWVPADHTNDELGDLASEDHGLQPEISNRAKWLVPMSLPVRVSDNNTVNTDNLKVQLDPVTGLPVIDPVTGSFIPLLDAEEKDHHSHELETDATCESDVEEDEAHDGESGTAGGWGMARYAYQLPELGLVDFSGSTAVWDGAVDGEYRPGDIRWYRFVNKPEVTKTVVVTADGRVLDGDTGAGRPVLTLMPYSFKDATGSTIKSAWAMLGYEESKGLGVPSDSDHQELETTEEVVAVEQEDEEGEFKGKDVIYHSFRFDQPDMVSAGNVVNLPALDDAGNLIPIFYKDAAGLPTEFVKQFATENARRPRFLAQPVKEMGATRTPLVVVYRQGREGNGKPSDIFAVRAVVPTTDKATDNPYRFSNLQRYSTGAQTSDPNVMRYLRKHMNMTSATVEAMDPVEKAMDAEGNTWNKVGQWKQYGANLSDESFANPYSDAKGHRGFLDGDRIVLGYSFTPNWGRLGGDHMDFYVRRSFDGGKNWTTDPGATEDTVHTVIERDPVTREYVQKQYKYGPGAFEPGRNVSLLKGNSHTITDPRLVPPMGPGTLNPTYPEDDTYDPDIYYVAFGTAEVLHGLGEPLGETDTVKEDIFYTRTTDGGTTWHMVPWVINPDSSSPDAGETVYRFPWLAQGTPHQGHAQIRMHPSGTRLYAIWHQWTDGDEAASPHDVGNDIWFRRIDFMEPASSME